jgi:hypothetical protein
MLTNEAEFCPGVRSARAIYLGRQVDQSRGYIKPAASHRDTRHSSSNETKRESLERFSYTTSLLSFPKRGSITLVSALTDTYTRSLMGDGKKFGFWSVISSWIACFRSPKTATSTGYKVRGPYDPAGEMVAAGKHFSSAHKINFG